MNPRGTVGVAIKIYTGRSPIELEAFLDPIVPGVYAFQAKFADAPKVVQFLVRNVLLQHIASRHLEEVEFTSWPPEVL